MKTGERDIKNTPRPSGYSWETESQASRNLRGAFSIIYLFPCWQYAANQDLQGGQLLDLCFRRACATFILCYLLLEHVTMPVKWQLNRPLGCVFHVTFSYVPLKDDVNFLDFMQGEIVNWRKIWHDTWAPLHLTRSLVKGFLSEVDFCSSLLTWACARLGSISLVMFWEDLLLGSPSSAEELWNGDSWTIVSIFKCFLLPPG